MENSLGGIAAWLVTFSEVLSTHCHKSPADAAGYAGGGWIVGAIPTLLIPCVPRMANTVLAISVLVAALCGCRATHAPSAPARPADCTALFDPAADYFPDKIAFRHSAQLSVSYHGHYKVLSFKPSVATQETFRYALVQCGTPVPSGFTANEVVTVPAPTFATMDQSMASAAVAMDLTDRLVGIASVRSYTSPVILERHRQGRIEELGAGTHSNIEKALAVRPDLYFTFYSAYPQYNMHPKLWEVGIKAVPFSDHTETTALGRAEWVKYLALFFNTERLANRIFDNAEREYLKLAELTSRVRERPEVMVGASGNKDEWQLHGGRNFMASLIQDAGGRYFWQRDQIAGSLVFTTFERALDASERTLFWTTAPWSGTSLKAILGLDARLKLFRPVRDRNVHGWIKGSNIPWRYPYSDQSLDKPHVVLADLISVLHPELLPDYKRQYLRRLDP